MFFECLRRHLVILKFILKNDQSQEMLENFDSFIIIQKRSYIKIFFFIQLKLKNPCLAKTTCSQTSRKIFDLPSVNSSRTFRSTFISCENIICKNNNKNILIKFILHRGQGTAFYRTRRFGLAAIENIHRSRFE